MRPNAAARKVLAMGKAYPVSPVRYALIVRNADGEKVGNTGSIRDEAGTRRLAHEMMRLIPAAAFVDIYDWRPGLDLSAAQPRETVQREEEA